MNTKRTIRIALAAFVSAAIAVPSALGGGEPKNDKPFTRPAGAATVRTVRIVSDTSSPAVSGEPKNQWPFTARAVPDPGLKNALREASSPTLGLSGESKNQPPFTAQVVASGRAFDWGDAGIGALAAVGIGALVAGAYLLTTSARRPDAFGTHA